MDGITAPGKAAFGIWSGGHYLHFGEDVGEERLKNLVWHAWNRGVRTFFTADVYGEGAADRLLGQALSEFPRDSYFLIGAVGHDFYKGQRQGEKGFPRFTDPALRTTAEYGTYLRIAATKSLERLATDHFDMLMLHNPDSTGYTSKAVWTGLSSLKQQGLTRMLGVAPGPANGFTLDMIAAFERFGSDIDWAMIILNPMESWPGGLVLPAAQKLGVRIITRVVEYGGLFHDGLRPGAKLSRTDHRSFRPAGWIEAAHDRMERYRAMARERGITLLQLACLWALAQPVVESVVPTLLQEAGSEAKPIEQQVDELAGVASCAPLPVEMVAEMTTIGDNRNSMSLKGASSQYAGEPQPDQWPLTPDLRDIGKRWGIVPDRELYYAGDPREMREIGTAINGTVQASERRLFLQLHAFTNCKDNAAMVEAMKASGIEGVLYDDVADPLGIAVLFIAENPDFFVTQARALMTTEPFASLTHRPELTMFGRTYSAGREPDLDDWLLRKPRVNALNPKWPWAIWYPLRRKPEFELLSKADQGKILMEHAMLGRNYGQSGYAHDIRLASYGLDANDNEFVLGLVGPELHPLSRLVQDMRKTQQTAKYIQSLGPFFVGKARWQSPMPKELQS